MLSPTYWIQNVCVLLAIILLTACNDEPEANLNVPDTYESPDYESNVTFERTLRSELSTMVSAANAVEANALAGNFNSGSITYPANLQGVTNSTYAALIQNWLGEIVQAANSGQAFDLENAPSGQGGLLGTRLLDENGIELEQLLDKGLYGAAFYNQALAIVNSDNLTQASIDRLVEIFGAHPSFPGDDTAPENPDKFAANYAQRRSNNVNKTGLYYDIKKNLITAREAIGEGAFYDQVRDAALDAFLLNWEKANFATIIYYCNDAKNKIVNANNESDITARSFLLGDALHSYSEAVGFVYGWLGLSQKEITDAELTELLNLLMVTPNQTPESYRFAKEAGLLTNFDQVIDKIQAIYGFSEVEVSSFFVNN